MRDHDVRELCPRSNQRLKRRVIGVYVGKAGHLVELLGVLVGVLGGGLKLFHACGQGPQGSFGLAIVPGLAAGAVDAFKVRRLLDAAAFNAAVVADKLSSLRGAVLILGRAWCCPVSLCFVRSHARPGEGGPQRRPSDMEKVICERGGH